MHQSGHSLAHSMHTVQFSSSSPITPRLRAGSPVTPPVDRSIGPPASPAGRSIGAEPASPGLTPAPSLRESRTAAAGARRAPRRHDHRDPLPPATPWPPAPRVQNPYATDAPRTHLAAEAAPAVDDPKKSRRTFHASRARATRRLDKSR